MVSEAISCGFSQTHKLQTLVKFFPNIHNKPLCNRTVNRHNFVMSNPQVIETIFLKKNLKKKILSTSSKHMAPDQLENFVKVYETQCFSSPNTSLLWSLLSHGEQNRCICVSVSIIMCKIIG